MKKLVVLLLILLGFAGPATATEIAGTKLAPEIKVSGETLHLNGYGIRKKFFFKIYIGSLYTARQMTSTDQVLADSGGKLIRMNFLYSKVEKEKIVDAFAEGFANNSPALADTQAAKSFLAWFDADFLANDQVDLNIAADNTVSATHNGRALGSLTSPELARGVLLIYLGDKPADADMKGGMLGQE